MRATLEVARCIELANTARISITKETAKGSKSIDPLAIYELDLDNFDQQPKFMVLKQRLSRRISL